jgi:hypothetical protein
VFVSFLIARDNEENESANENVSVNVNVNDDVNESESESEIEIEIGVVVAAAVVRIDLCLDPGPYLCRDHHHCDETFLQIYVDHPFRAHQEHELRRRHRVRHNNQ